MSPENVEFVAIVVIGPDADRIIRSLRDLAPRLGLAPLSETFNHAIGLEAHRLHALPTGSHLIAVPVPAMTGRAVADDTIAWDGEGTHA